DELDDRLNTLQASLTKELETMRAKPAATPATANARNPEGSYAVMRQREAEQQILTFMTAIEQAAAGAGENGEYLKQNVNRLE
ncbi:hypothetical protein, partial [Tepidimonas taiwanensis]|uniref:hypothetical protein n=1 Tax=Tepidimonas taiwanensis TaxID=307486 RepID=UPI001F3AE238